jgi:hypothetical protein
MSDEVDHFAVTEFNALKLHKASDTHPNHFNDGYLVIVNAELVILTDA